MTEPSLSGPELALGKKCGLRSWVNRTKTGVQNYYPSIELIRDAYRSRTDREPGHMYLAKGLAALLDEEGFLLQHILSKGAVDISDDDALWERICLVAAKLIMQKWLESEDPQDG